MKSPLYISAIDEVICVGIYWGGNHHPRLLGRENNLILTHLSGRVTYVDRVTGSQYCHPEFQVWQLFKREEQSRYKWEGDLLRSFEYERGGQQEAYKKALSFLREQAKKGSKL
jgi:hypothetical protein